MSLQPADPEASVRSKFTVKDSFQLPDGELEFSVEYGAGSKQRFEELCRELGASGFTPRLVGEEDKALLFVRRSRPPERSHSVLPFTLALLAAGAVLAFALLLGSIYQSYGPSIPEASVVVLYAAAVGAFLGAHQLGQAIAARRSGEPRPVPFALPGIPGVTAALPALGILSRQRAPAVNRDRHFGILIAGPLLGLAAAVVLYVAGAALSVPSAVPVQSCQTVNGTQTLCPSLIQIGLDSVIGPLVPSVAPGHSALSPLADGATVGLILTFVGLLPMATFDGGQISSLAWGAGRARVASYLSVLLLILVDVPTYWALALVALLLMNLSRSSEPALLDEVSPLSRRRKWLYLCALVLAFLCLPLPQSLAGLPL